MIKIELPATRHEALAIGAGHYFTGKPCSQGHVTKRHLTGTCVECARAAVKRWESRNPGEGLKRSRAWQKRYPERARENSRRSWRKNAGMPEPTRPVPEYCECCGEKLIPGIQTHLDHCHRTGKFRGWLCNRCNRGLGYFGDSIEGLQKAISYLQRV